MLSLAQGRAPIIARRAWSLQAVIPNIAARHNNTKRSNVTSAQCVSRRERVPWLSSVQCATSPLLMQQEACLPVLQSYPHDNIPRDLDAILVLGGGLMEDGGLPPWVVRRLEVGAGLALQQERACPVVCLGGGTPHKPPVLETSSGHVIHEATACAKFLLHAGLPATRILKEISSYDTVGNAFFSLTIHAIPGRWRRVAVVTSDFHMKRSAALFQHIWAAGARSVFQDANWFDLVFASASDGAGLWSDDVLAARAAKEASSLETWRANASHLYTLAQIHQWLHDTHQCYAVTRQHEFSKTSADPCLLASY